MSGIFSQCTACFRGQREPAVVEEFLSAICIFKELNSISNTDALRELPLLLEDYAAAWWIGVQDTICTFEQAVALIRVTFSPPDWRIFVDFFEIKQQKNEPTDSFVSKKRYLLSQLKVPPSEVIQLNMVYALLSRSIKEHVQREYINSFEDLISASREAELIILEAPPAEPSNTEERKASRCSFCRSRGHSIETCLKKKKRDEERGVQDQLNTELQMAELKRKPVFSCYGCGAPNVYKSKCSACTEKSARVTTIGHSLPTTKAKFFGSKHEVVFDTGAKTSVASLKLHSMLTAKGCVFQTMPADITLADGSFITINVMTTICNVFLGNRFLEIKIIFFSNAKNEKSLLGTDFLEQNGIVLNMAQRYWFFEDEPKQKYSFTNPLKNATANEDVQYAENQDKPNSCAENSSNLFGPPSKIRKVQTKESREDLISSLF